MPGGARPRLHGTDQRSVGARARQAESGGDLWIALDLQEPALPLVQPAGYMRIERLSEFAQPPLAGPDVSPLDEPRHAVHDLVLEQ